MTAVASIFRRELAGYFTTPVAYVFIVIFLILTGLFTVYIGGIFDRGQADLTAFFAYHPWLYLFLIPAIAMRLWAEERRSGTVELLMTLPVPVWAAILGKFLAAWVFAGIALALTFPIWITVNWLGNPDNGVIVAGYLGSWAMAGGYLSIGVAMSALSKNQVIAFVLAVSVCFLFTVSGFPIVLDAIEAIAPDGLTRLVAGFSFLTRFADISQGVLDARDFLYFGLLIGFWLILNRIILEMKREAGG